VRLVAALLGLLSAVVAGCGHAPADSTASAEAADPRAAIVLEPAERQLVLAEMRDFVRALRGIVEAAAEDDMKRVAAAARAAGLAAHRKDLQNPDSLLARTAKKMPPEFRKLGFATHTAFDEIAVHAEQFGDRRMILRQLAENLGRCVACHTAYRFPERP
jgi:hypothetical protein